MSNVLCPEGPNLAPFRNTSNRFWDIEKKLKIQYGHQRPSWMHLHVIRNTHWQYIMINFHPVGPDFHPFRSRSNRFWDIQKDGKSNMAAGGHLGCTFMLFVQHSDYISWLTLTLWAQIFIRFALGATVSEIFRKTENPIWPPAAILDAHSCYSYNTVTIYTHVTINFNPMGSNLHPFRYMSNHFWDIEEDGKSNMANTLTMYND